jgi:hypothetical protein
VGRCLRRNLGDRLQRKHRAADDLDDTLGNLSRSVDHGMPGEQVQPAQLRGELVASRCGVELGENTKPFILVDAASMRSAIVEVGKTFRPPRPANVRGGRLFDSTHCRWLKQRMAIALHAGQYTTTRSIRGPASR